MWSRSIAPVMPFDRPTTARLIAIAGFRLVTADLSRLCRFYAETLGFTVEGAARPIERKEMSLLGLAGTGTRQTLCLGEQVVDIDCFDEPGKPYPGGDAASPWFQHLAIVVADMSAAYGRVVGATAISHSGPQRLPPSSGGVTAYKFRDPDGHPLELLEFPTDAVAAPWRGRRPAAGAIGLGIDHSAISVSDPATSEAFYCPLGLSPEKPTRNEGAEQAHLDDLPGVPVTVVPLRPSAGVPHLELLGYQVHDERSRLNLSANDVAATRVAWSSEVDGLLRDPDGHLLQLLAEDKLHA